MNLKYNIIMKDNTRYERSWIIMGGVLSVLFLENDIKPIRQNTTIEFCRARRFRRFFIIFWTILPSRLKIKV